MDWGLGATRDLVEERILLHSIPYHRLVQTGQSISYLIIHFSFQTYGIASDGRKTKNYYFEISSAIAAGFLVSAIHNAGLVTVTTTPMNATSKIRKLLNRPPNEKVLLLLPVGTMPLFLWCCSPSRLSSRRRSRSWNYQKIGRGSDGGEGISYWSLHCVSLLE